MKKLLIAYLFLIQIMLYSSQEGTKKPLKLHYKISTGCEDDIKETTIIHFLTD